MDRDKYKYDEDTKIYYIEIDMWINLKRHRDRHRYNKHITK